MVWAWWVCPSARHIEIWCEHVEYVPQGILPASHLFCLSVRESAPYPPYLPAYLSVCLLARRPLGLLTCPRACIFVCLPPLLATPPVTACLPLCLPAHELACLHTSLSLCLPAHEPTPSYACPRAYLSVCLPTNLPAHKSACPPTSPPLRLPAHEPACTRACLPARPRAYLFVCLPTGLPDTLACHPCLPFCLPHFLPARPLLSFWFCYWSLISRVPSQAINRTRWVSATLIEKSKIHLASPAFFISCLEQHAECAQTQWVISWGHDLLRRNNKTQTDHRFFTRSNTCIQVKEDIPYMYN